VGVQCRRGLVAAFFGRLRRRRHGHVDRVRLEVPGKEQRAYV
jgi:surfactin synthase thioesterase subunit